MVLDFEVLNKGIAFKNIFFNFNAFKNILFFLLLFCNRLFVDNRRYRYTFFETN